MLLGGRRICYLDYADALSFMYIMNWAMGDVGRLI